MPHCSWILFCQIRIVLIFHFTFQSYAADRIDEYYRLKDELQLEHMHGFTEGWQAKRHYED